MTTLHEKIAMQIIEHAHLGAKNSAKTEALLIAALCEFSLRGSGNAPANGNWGYVEGADNTIALTESDVESDPNFLRPIG